MSDVNTRKPKALPTIDKDGYEIKANLKRLRDSRSIVRRGRKSLVDNHTIDVVDAPPVKKKHRVTKPITTLPHVRSDSDHVVKSTLPTVTRRHINNHLPAARALTPRRYKIDPTGKTDAEVKDLTRKLRSGYSGLRRTVNLTSLTGNIHRNTERNASIASEAAETAARRLAFQKKQAEEAAAKQVNKAAEKKAKEAAAKQAAELLSKQRESEQATKRAVEEAKEKAIAKVPKNTEASDAMLARRAAEREAANAERKAARHAANSMPAKSKLGFKSKVGIGVGITTTLGLAGYGIHKLRAKRKMDRDSTS